MTAEQLTDAANILSRCLERYNRCALDAAEEKRALELAKADLYAEKRVNGSNAEERAANLRIALSGYYDALERAENTLMTARSEVEVARVTWDCLRYQIRLLESTK